MISERVFIEWLLVTSVLWAACAYWTYQAGRATEIKRHMREGRTR